MFYVPSTCDPTPSDLVVRYEGPECPICETHLRDEDEAIKLDGKYYHLDCFIDRYGEIYYREEE